MPNAPRTVVLGTRTSSETKARFAALAARQGITESALLALLVDNVLMANTSSDVVKPTSRTGGEGRANERLTLRLRPSDRALAERRAAARGMKTGSYLTLLIRNHLRGDAVMAPLELNQLKAMAGHLAALGRQLRIFGMPKVVTTTDPSGLHDLLAHLRSEVESVREATAAAVRQNLISWEAGDA